ncbi:hypothetical protein DSO57_1001089 [Entomophthora muscae]|uniref:Uncharacterized protein n=1 Tax=Entomophthora muscae TaxID=34485 RepID=A0ACC2SBB3_9FUNG|nr:hypothetical protein DSO57_1001089 [Entomophthora muscae]
MVSKTSKRCDRCYMKHLRCDRVRPRCGTCLLEQTSCSYTTRQKDDVLPKYHQQITVIDFKKQQLFSTTPILEIMLRLPSRSFVLGTVALLQFPNIHALGLKMFISSCVHMCTGLARNRRKLSASAGTSASYTRVSEKLCLEGEDAFFKYVNPFLGLFAKQAFHVRPRSPVLRLTVVLCGLHFCTEETQQARDSLFETLGRSFLPGCLSFSLDTLQAIVILLAGLTGTHWVIRRNHFLYSLACTVAHAIGLHMPTANPERRMLANSLTYLLHHASITKTPVFIALPCQKPGDFSDKPHISAHLFWSLNSLLPHLISLKNDIIDSPAPLVDIEPRLLHLEANLQRISLEFMTGLHRLPIKFPFVYSFYFAYYFFLLATMRLYRSTTNFVPLCLPPPSSKSTRKAVDCALCALRWGIKIHKTYTHWYYLCKFTHCIIFLSRHRLSLEPAELTLLDAATSHLKRLNTLPYLGSVTYYLKFIEKLEKCPALFFD